MYANRRSQLRDESGFTLIELAVAMPIMLIIMTGLLLMLSTVTHWSSQSQEETILQTEARSAMNVLSADIRGAFYGDGITAEVSSATATSITFTTPDEYGTTVTANSESAFHLLTVSYQVTGGMLQRQYKTSTNTFPTAPSTQAWNFPASMGPWQTVVGQQGSITNTDVFTFYTATGMATTPPTPLTFPIASTVGIRAVGIKMTLSTLGSQPDTFTVTDIVSLRQTDN
jgi:prepilin-type N-terminal cleavage/methylation domain-containing protein